MHCRPCGDGAEGRRVRAGQPDLRAEGLEPIEQGFAALGIEMGGDLVEQDDRRHAGETRDKTGMGEHDAEEQRLLLAGRGVGGGDALRPMDDGKIGEVGSLKRAASRTVARPRDRRSTSR